MLNENCMFFAKATILSLNIRFGGRYGKAVWMLDGKLC
jgi:hypothetical protein